MSEWPMATCRALGLTPCWIEMEAYVIWFVVLMFVGLVNGALVGGATALAKPRQAS